MKKIFFIGIGGIGISALARRYLARGWEVSGSDAAASEITRSLQKAGMRLFIKKTADLKIIAPDLVVYSLAVMRDHPELKQALRLGVKTMSYPQALGELTKKHNTIAVAGAHGKSTTAAMIGLMLAAAKMDPVVILGTKVKKFKNSNFRDGKSDLLVIEACEYAQAFLNYYPQISVVTNIEMDHIECYENEKKLMAAFEKFAGNMKTGGKLLICADDANAKKLGEAMQKKGTKVLYYSLAMPEAKILRKNLRIPGEHNVANALAALTVGRAIGVTDKIIFESLARYRGSWRRFDCRPAKIGDKKFTAVFDYGHHPTQIKLTMEAVRAKWPKKRIICLFQPHQAWRTYLLFDDFVKVFRSAPLDEVFITDIYQVAGRENAKIAKSVNSEKLVFEIGRGEVEYVPKKRIIARLKREIKGGEIVLIMGAGDIYDLSKYLTKRAKKI